MYEATSGLATPATVTSQATATEDATVTALNKEQLAQTVAQQQHTWDNWLWSNAATILSSFLSTLVIVIGALFGLWRWRRDQHTEREKRAEERFQAAVTGLGEEKEGARIGAAILLRTFLRPGYEQFYTQTFDLVVANLRLPRDSILNQALIQLFLEGFPLVRDELKKRKGNQFHVQSLSASNIQIDKAFLWRADLEQVYMPWASMQEVTLTEANLRAAQLWEVNLSKADLYATCLSDVDLGGSKLTEAFLKKVDFSGARLSAVNFSKANLTEANLSGADLWKANFGGADLGGANLSNVRHLEWVQSWKDTNLRGVKGLTKEQLAACQVSGAIIDEDATRDSSLSTVPSASLPQIDKMRASPDPDRSNAASSEPEL
jgi:uncharacterized protein YjbI with pentapeptide repeats